MIVSKQIIGYPDECRELYRTETSWPLGAADRLVEPIDLSRYNYGEREYLVKGYSRVYEWPKGEKLPVVQHGAAPYTTRILVRKPIDPQDFSGVIVVELLNWASKYDRTIPGWGQCFDYYLAHGMAWVGLTVRDVALDAMKRFDPDRYSELSFANPKPEDLRGEPATCYGRCDIANENGLVWDMISQLGALLKSKSSQNPFYGCEVRKVMVTGATAGDLSAYIAGFHPLHRTVECEPVYDGFLMYMTGAPGGVNQETNKNSELDPRDKYYAEVPFIHVLTTGDMLGGGFHPDWAYMQRRPDVNEPDKKLARYEVAGCGVRSGYDKARCACREDIERSGLPWRESVDYEYEYPVRYILRAATERLVAWMETGEEPPHSPLLETKGEYPNVEYVRDVAGNAYGGIRLPYVDAPLYRYYEEGGAVRLPAAVIRSLYRSREDYLEQVIASCLSAYEGGWILKEDAVAIVLEAISEGLPELEEEWGDV